MECHGTRRATLIGVLAAAIPQQPAGNNAPARRRRASKRPSKSVEQRILERHALRIVLAASASPAPLILFFSAHAFLVQIGLTARHRRLGMAKNL